MFHIELQGIDKRCTTEDQGRASEVWCPSLTSFVSMQHGERLKQQKKMSQIGKKEFQNEGTDSVGEPDKKKVSS